MSPCTNKECEYWGINGLAQCEAIHQEAFHKCKDYIPEEEMKIDAIAADMGEGTKPEGSRFIIDIEDNKPDDPRMETEY